MATRMLEGKSFVITGAGSGIGRAIALACAAEGASLTLAGRTLANVQQTADLIAGDGGALPLIQQTDVASPEALEDLFRQATARFGGLDGLVANAGVMAPSPPVQDMRAAHWKDAIDVNLLGTLLTVSIGAKVLADQGRGGSILATGSSLVLRPGQNMAAYVTAKAAIHAFMKVAALDLAPHRIRVNTLVPGTTATPPLQQMEGFLERASALNPLGEVVSPEELGRYAAFVLSDALPHMTGSALLVDAGRSIG